MARPAATTRAAIDAAAFDLFRQRGFDDVSAQDIADACGISRPTLFRYVPRMQDIVLDRVAAFGELTVERTRATPGDAWSAMSAALASCHAELLAGSPHTAAFELLADDPGLRGRSSLLTRAWRESMAAALAERGAGDHVICEALAGAAIGVMTAALARGWPTETLSRALSACAPADPGASVALGSTPQ